MPYGSDPNDVYHNGQWYKRSSVPLNGSLFPSILATDYSGSPSRLSVLKTAVAANSAVVSVVGMSIEAAANQAPVAAGLFRLLKRRLKQALPNVTFTFNNLSIGGTTADQPLSWTSKQTSPSGTQFTVPTTTNANYEERWTGITPTDGKLWMQYAADTAPDLLILHFDLNDATPQTFRTNMLALINDVDTDAKWAGKRPSLMMVASHTGLTTPSIIRQNHRILRSIAVEKGIPLIDAGRIYDLMTTGYDPLDYGAVWDTELFDKPWVAGAPNYGRIPGSGSDFTLDPVYWDAVNCASNTTGVDLRAVAAAAMSFLRKRLHTDGAVQQQFQSFNASNTFSIFYRIDPTDANYSAATAGGGTAQGYELRLSGTTLTLYWRASGQAVSSIGSVNLTNGVSTSSVHLVRVEYSGGRHYAEIICNSSGASSERRELEVFHGGYIGDGYSGVGTTGGATARVTVSSTNVKQSSVMDFAAPVQVTNPQIGEVEAFGSGPSTAFLATFGQSQGNGTNHPTSLGLTSCYEAAIGVALRGIKGLLA